LGIVNLRVAVVLGVCLAASAAAVRAHEVGTTRVVVTIGSGRYGVDISTDAAALLGRLESQRGGAAWETLDASEYELRLQSLAFDLLRCAELRFGDVVAQSTLQVAITPLPGAGASESDVDAFVLPRARLTLTGTVPDNARSVSWRYDFSATTYELDVVADGQSETQWLDGGQWSRPAAITDGRAGSRGFRLGFSRVFPAGVDQIVFLLGLYLCATGWRSLTKQLVAFAGGEILILGLVANGVVSLPAAVVRPVLALTIAAVAGVNFLPPAWGRGRHWSFGGAGLVHGLALAPALDGGASAASKFLGMLAPVCFGVQCAQLLLIVGAFLILGAPGRVHAHRHQVVVPASALIGLAGLYWIFQRLPIS
jgi:hypothetical protein